MKKGKKYLEAQKKIDASKRYTIEEAAQLVKATATTKFDATIDISFRLNINTTLADQQLRGTISLPHGNGKTKKILAITHDVEKAKEAGADYYGGKEMLDKIKAENWFDFDVIVATPDMMGELGKMGRLLGPKGLMPNPKTGTVAPDIAKAIIEIKNGKIEYRADKEGNMHLSIARCSFSDEFVIDNIKAIYNLVLKLRPASVKGAYVKNVVVHTTMGPAVKLVIDR